ncbi:glycosyl transferase [Dulcicalothrix desertica PCC 7102]|uniref:Glycosyl transferase n=1 Tax=Dulcicalothrix desertica PCC 7102 TaxID=232991 RepID=A0A433VET6_9CYAN|nr:glycosyltransferase [Dulcicalothrix desertica]RUT04626.1 glycosyl transferase [Dulcicalothrix desertica PCC 7102]TWH42632.1 glycosyltransferase involved in cell wall biosynthesis [Dulcicalothrix desertica PCC 7102]
MKILLVIPGIGDVYGGTSKVAIEFAQALGKLGIDIDIVTTNANGLEDLDVPLRTWLNQGLYRLQYFPRWHIGDYKLSTSLTKWLFKNVASYDLVHTIAVFSYPVSITHLACKINRVPYINSPHGMLEPWALSHKSWKKKLYYSLIEKAALDNASAIQMLNQAEAQNAEPLHLKAPLVTVPNGINCQEFQLQHNPKAFYEQFPHTRDKALILFLGRIDPKKGLDLLAPAFAKALSKFSNAHLIVAGPDSIGFLPTVQNYFAEEGCLNAVTFTGMLTGAMKYAALAAASIYVAPSYSEGFSMSVLEAMASGLPCVITKGCNFPEAANNQAALVVDIESSAIANALIDCLSNPEQAKIMGERARQLVFEKYTWDKVACQMQEVYSCLLQHQPVMAIS